MDVNSTTALVTGANRGIGRALVKALLDRGAARVYAAARDVGTLEPVVALDPKRVIPRWLSTSRTASRSRHCRNRSRICAC